MRKRNKLKVTHRLQAKCITCHQKQERKNAVYTSKLDMFSFGHLSLHTVLGDYPVVYEDDITPEVLQKGNAQIRKRQSSLSRIGNQHCLYPSIVKCLMDNPEKRPTARGDEQHAQSFSP